MLYFVDVDVECSVVCKINTYLMIWMCLNIEFFFFLIINIDVVIVIIYGSG